MKKTFAAMTLALVMMFAPAGSAFAAGSPDATPNPITPTIAGNTCGCSSTVAITPNPGNPDGGPTTAVTVSVAGDGTFATTGLSFAKTGTYTFTVSDPANPAEVYTLTVVVAEGSDGNLEATYSYTDKAGNAVSTLKFGDCANGASSTPGAGTQVPKTSGASGAGVTTPQTGDAALASTVLLAFAAVVSGVFLVASRRLGRR